ncbi:hypothetical protein BCV69DRAFT_32294 [Microstroma glucosiphilum]|uniref:Uncharacterized protein n=1 Tax=Pseudomicrostroma glucosiphilum TaxID=1684307 RepID=A0A316U4N9_9BASI|nr:hypothetical protein BCV69DRAFT_32294 [Pseudomicrostroma glucosiphilum]PWN19788.1 hypothetical protein BCV69DRAFT_32294 [Pseudomicrostroma glucosiphilum]
MPQRLNMRDDELSAIIQFAPVALVVLDRNRNLKRVNKFAETMLGLDAKMCTGAPFNAWVAESTRPTVTRAIRYAAESKWGESEHGSPWAQPAQSTVALTPRRTPEDRAGRPFWCGITIAACFDTPANSSKLYMHEAWYIITITLLSSSTTKPPSLPNFTTPVEVAPEEEAVLETAKQVAAANLGPDQEVESAVDDDRGPFDDLADPPLQTSLLAEAVAYNIDYAVVCMSSDGHTAVRNRTADSLLERISAGPGGGMYEENVENPPAAPPSDRTADSAPLEGEVDTAWLLSHFNCYDASFSQLLNFRDYPLYRCAILGQKIVNEQIGVIAKDGTRYVLEVTGIPLFDSGGDGRYIGGALFLKDVTRESFRASSMSVAEVALVDDSGSVDTIASFKRVCEDLPEIAWIANSDGYLEWYNHRWYEYTGSSFETSKGSSWTDYVHPADLPSVGKAWSKALRQESRYEVQERILAKDGTYKWMLCRAHPVRNSEGKVLRWFGMLTDVHATLNALASNREARENLSDAVRGADITLWAVNTEGIFTLAEGPLASLDAAKGSSISGSSAHSISAGSSGSEDARTDLPHLREPTKAPIVGRSIFEEWGGQRKDPIMQALQGEHVTEESTIRGRTYRTMYRPTRAQMNAPTSFLLTHEDDEAPIIGVTGMSFDITERLIMEKKFEESAREVARAEAASSAAKEASRMKSQFLAVISHEIRTPLNGVVGLSELLLDIDSLTAEAQDLVHSILRSSGALLTVINDVLDFSKVEAGKLDLVSLPFSLQLVCEDSARDFQKLMLSKGLELIKDIDLPDEIVLGDAGRITQVLNNLLANAGKFTERGSVMLKASKTREESGICYYSFKVADSGCGIPQAQLSSLFQPFRQADPSTSRKYGGSGLGLAICRNLIELMGGEISLESEEGVGTTVTFTVPLLKSATSDPQNPREELQSMFSTYQIGERTAMLTQTTTTTKTTACHTFAPGPASGAGTAAPSEDYLGFRRSSLVSTTTKSNSVKKARILLAEDNPVNSQIAIKTLQKLGYEVDHAENGAEVLEFYKKNEEYALVLMDCMMPTMDGFQATRLMRASSSLAMRKVPIIALTAAAIKGRDICLAAGMSDFLSKPVRRATLDAMLQKWVGLEHDTTTLMTPSMSNQDATTPVFE